MSQQFNAQFFINFFGAIPGKDWCSGNLVDGQGRKCAYGHLTPELSMEEINPELENEFNKLGIENGIDNFAAINNGKNPNYQQPTEKQRILAALRDIRNKEVVENEVCEMVIH